MTTRTDSHRPVALVTEDYEFVLAYDSQAGERLAPGTAPSEWLIWAMQQRAKAARLVTTSSLDRGLTQCHHCGAHMRYGAVLLHTSGEHIAVGETCLENRFDRATAEFQKLRKQGRLNAAQQRIVNRRLEWFAEDPSREVAFTFAEGRLAEGDYGWEGTFHGFVHKVNRYGDTSDRFVAMILRAKVRHETREAERAAREAAEAAEVREPVPTGRLEIMGEVLTTKWQDSDFGGSLKMLVKDTRGFKVWGSVPSKLTVERGDQVRFTAQVEPSKDDQYFGFFKRPTKAEVL